MTWSASEPIRQDGLQSIEERCEQGLGGGAMPLDSPMDGGDAAIQKARQLSSYPFGIPDSVVEGKRWTFSHKSILSPPRCCN